MSIPSAGVGPDIPRRPDPGLPFGAIVPAPDVQGDDLDALLALAPEHS